jgi:DNA-binding transcriptional LysR family regulator
LRTFVEVTRDGSLSAAARRLGLAQPTVGRHIDALETALGLTLFTRSPRGLTPTSAALALEPHVEAMAAAAAAFGRAASGEAAADRGTVRVTASEVIGCEVLMSEEVYVRAGFAPDALPAHEIDARGREALVKARSAARAADLAIPQATPASLGA